MCFNRVSMTPGRCRLLSRLNFVERVAGIESSVLMVVDTVFPGW